ncbi:hypothetical protein BDK51DRAFT_34861 [Blyttiomyces helicus]|uniref:Uncharacterized protein n=1 Tax=Blyttiomyces helicus TaxID=388810 RepID=A0A4P9WN71_9FUNG|nr:hypothetical protein BDK51DRAFT_34861 [Blyttiomyces helicus]|eukprot:RKO94374.1 hypothetical protein BDK51DRAFT_34861 [Blyttiomyces helicus]
MARACRSRGSLWTGLQVLGRGKGSVQATDSAGLLPIRARGGEFSERGQAVPRGRFARAAAVVSKLVQQGRVRTTAAAGQLAAGSRGRSPMAVARRPLSSWLVGRGRAAGSLAGTWRLADDPLRLWDQQGHTRVVTSSGMDGMERTSNV